MLFRLFTTAAFRLLTGSCGFLCRITVGSFTNKRPAPASQSFAGTVVRVVDGDTAHVLIGSQVHSIRFADIDAPEHNQPYGAQAQAALDRLIAGQAVELQVLGTDCYGRILAHVFAQGAWVNYTMVARGYAWSEADGKVKETFEFAEANARRHGCGLWAHPMPCRPKLWRKAYPLYA